MIVVAIFVLGQSLWLYAPPPVTLLPAASLTVEMPVVDEERPFVTTTHQTLFAVQAGLQATWNNSTLEPHWLALQQTVQAYFD